jgi:hypothetical protein
VFHASQLRQVAGTLEGDRWVAINISGSTQVIVDRICGQNVCVPTNADLWNEEYVLIQPDRGYRVCHGAVAAVGSINEYLRVLKRLPLLAVDVTLALKTFLSHYNDKCAKLILGQQAVHGLARLKSITSKNLALCSECISLVGALIPHIKTALKAYLSERQVVLLDSYSKLEEEFEDHKSKIFAMLVNIMRQAAVTGVQRMRGMVVEWGAFPDRISSYVTGLTDTVRTMHKLLFNILSRADLEIILNETFRVYNQMLWEAMQSLDRPTKNARKRLRNDVRVLTENLKSFEGVSSTFGTKLLELVEQAFQ